MPGRDARSPDDSAVLPPLRDVLVRLARRFAGTLATTVVVLVHVAALGALGAGAAAGLAWLPLGAAAALGASDGNRAIDGAARAAAAARGRPRAGAVVAGPARARDSVHAPSTDDRRGRRSGGHATPTRGRVGSVLGLLVVTTVASSVLVLLCRAAGSLATLLVAPDRFRPIFGEGPLRSGAGAGVQLGATLAATFVTLPLVLLPLAVIAVSLHRTRHR